MWWKLLLSFLAGVIVTIAAVIAFSLWFMDSLAHDPIKGWQESPGTPATTPGATP